MKKILLSLSLLTLTCACAIPLPAQEMVPMTDVYTQLPVNKLMERKIAIGSASVADEAKLHGMVTNEAYAEALQSALLTSNYAVRGTEPAQYQLDASLLEFDLPFVGFNLDCYATATYTLRNKITGQIISTDTVKSHYEAKFGESFDGNMRMRICVAKSIRENITHYLRQLTTKSVNKQ